ncbi:response regulator [Roseicella sp. DB1501]|jgi:CheY-like chemotaxis protein|uniref:response regulator n=1 Tax=Roseicella sp. DB1501 TaxID=2730925 RepID=UPI001491E573|nr:response regulator [Roseicella sp. DB1501]NOG70843.1 response regulator [Roseicella sp. DB1501]
MAFAEAASHTILVVEDDYFIATDIATYLAESGFEVLIANSADGAIERIMSGHIIHLVFSDIQMPGSMDGIGLAKWMREHRPDIKLILTSGVINAANELRALCDDGPIAKPYIRSFVAERIRHHLGDDSPTHL